MSAYDGVLVTYRYLRLAMVTVLVLLLAAVVVEWLHTGPSCWQDSISAYYFTPVQSVFSASLLALGMGMIVLKGSTPLEDLLLNVGGMLAAVVGLVPVPQVGTCRSAALVARDIPANVANNMAALFVAGALGLGVTLVVGARSATGPRGRERGWRSPRCCGPPGWPGSSSGATRSSRARTTWPPSVCSPRWSALSPPTPTACGVPGRGRGSPPRPPSSPTGTP